MKRYAALTLAAMMMCIAAIATACGTYILIPDSDTRLLFEDEVRGYHEETLGFVLNEILARHGYHFDPAGEYYDHFMNLSYLYPHDSGFPYREASEDVSNEMIVAGLSEIECQNIELIRRIQTEKRNANDCSGFLADWSCSEPIEALEVDPVGYNWQSVDLPLNLRIPVYSGPGEQYLRGDNGYASVNTNKLIYAFGFDGEWLMISYFADPETRQTRVGYIHKDMFARELNPAICEPREVEDDEDALCSQHHLRIDQLELERKSITLPVGVTVTDDPTGIKTPLAYLEAGETVTLLRKFPLDEEMFEDDEQWYYIEYEGQVSVRGFIPVELLK